MPIRLREWDNSALQHRTVASLGWGEVQLWFASVPYDEAELNQRAHSLSADERERMQRFQHHEVRGHFIIGRDLLRQLLGAYLNATPSAPMLGFNLAHSGNVVVVALARGREVGVDIERMRRLNDWRLVAERIFSPRELKELHSLPESKQREAFFNGWTRKEAYLKATGEGLIDDLPAIEVTFAPGEPPRFLALPGGEKSTPHWTVHSIPLPRGYAGAVVVEDERG